jgi:hypothetical protein
MMYAAITLSPHLLHDNLLLLDGLQQSNLAYCVLRAGKRPWSAAFVKRHAACARAKEQQQAMRQAQQLERRAAHGAVLQQLLQVPLLAGL